MNFDTTKTSETPPFLEGKSEKAIQYWNISCQMMQQRIDSRMGTLAPLDNTFEGQLMDIWETLTVEEEEELNNLPSMWWFQYNQEMKSELDVYPYANHFVKQKPLMIPDVSTIKSKESKLVKEPWKNGDVFLYLFIAEEDNLNMISMKNTHFQFLQDNYDFVQMSGVMPTFKKK